LRRSRWHAIGWRLVWLVALVGLVRLWRSAGDRFAGLHGDAHGVGKQRPDRGGRDAGQRGRHGNWRRIHSGARANSTADQGRAGGAHRSRRAKQVGGIKSRRLEIEVDIHA